MAHVLLARIALSCLCGVQGIANLAIDCNRTHATNPLWTGHARFHVVWQAGTSALAAALQVVLIWAAWPLPESSFYLACLLAALSPIGFLGAALTRRLYGGTFSDVNGIPPVYLRLRTRSIAIDLNLCVVIAALLCLGLFLYLYRS